MNTKSNSETDMKTKQPGINFVPTARQGFRTMYWSKCIVLFPCFSLLISAKNFENKLSDCNDGGSKFRLDFGESYCVPVNCWITQAEEILNIKIKSQSALIYLF